MNPSSDHGAEAFFRDLRRAFERTLGVTSTHADVTQPADASLVQAVMIQAWDSFEGNVAIQSEGQPPIACHKGCPSCCTLRVTALAPEVFMVAAYLRTTAQALESHGIDLIGQLRANDAATRGLDELERVALRRRCAFIKQGVCLIHRVRPLACRGHASHDKRACVEAAAGRVDEVPFSGPHRMVRMLVQSALQAGLRRRGLDWGAYELNHALVLALDDGTAQASWLSGADPLAAAAVDREFREAMAAGFDAAGS
ncbi:YkgJ family cysteine cluster protein [Rhodoferax sp.]|uniref:YkgJ family cysteine cluster protein n=1 Tax=Rhodoferax sp. TaxID=50421 RepID=UPI002718D41F|nr:YkgJ family cysteine cluster protein [Rhodoferax sp.]MDO8319880.1 YkgJ family cysteine cluster protein [Rhodoferax sp.]MDP2679618.1 YkgJ family cysteine cluster protein [Rhodoferax sp.]